MCADSTQPAGCTCRIVPYCHTHCRQRARREAALEGELDELRRQALELSGRMAQLAARAEDALRGRAEAQEVRRQGQRAAAQALQEARRARAAEEEAAGLREQLRMLRQQQQGQGQGQGHPATAAAAAGSDPSAAGAAGAGTAEGPQAGAAAEAEMGASLRLQAARDAAEIRELRALALRLAA